MTVIVLLLENIMQNIMQTSNDNIVLYLLIEKITL